jgi:nucleoside-diphosphate-sugar epimerase
MVERPQSKPMVFIAGVSGFIGRRLVAALEERIGDINGVCSQRKDRYATGPCPLLPGVAIRDRRAVNEVRLTPIDFLAG